MANPDIFPEKDIGRQSDALKVVARVFEIYLQRLAARTKINAAAHIAGLFN